MMRLCLLQIALAAEGRATLVACEAGVDYFQESWAYRRGAQILVDL